MTKLEDKLIDQDSERRVISAVLDNEEACIEATNRLVEGDFTYPLHRKLFEIITSLFQQDIRPTFIELLKELDRLGIYRSQQEISEISYIAEHFVDDGNAAYWITRVKNASKLRQLDTYLNRTKNKLMEFKGEDADKLLYEAETELSTINALEFDGIVDGPEDIAELGYSEVERRCVRYREIQDEHKGVLPLDGLPTGFEYLDKVTLGYNVGDLILLSAQTGHGKTAFALHTAATIAITAKKPESVIYLNTEMSRKQIALRMGAMLARVDHEKLRKGDLTQAEFSRVATAYGQIKESKFYSYYCPNLTPQKTVSIARKFKAQKNIQMMILDYVGRMDKIDANLKEWQILEQIVKTMKILAQNLQVVSMCLVQLTEEGKLEGARRMKNEADVMLKLIPVSSTDIENNKELRGFRDVNYRIRVDKNRDGVSGNDLAIHFDKKRQFMKDAQLAN